MKKIVLVIVILGITTLGGIVLNKNISSARHGEELTVLGSLSGQPLHKAELEIEGMWCASCAVGAEYNLKAIEGVVDAYVGFSDNLDGEGWIVYEEKRVDKEQIIKAIKPYQATIVADVPYSD